MIFSCVLFYSINFQQICEREKDIEKKKEKTKLPLVVFHVRPPTNILLKEKFK